MEELFIKCAKLYTEYEVLVTCFAHPNGFRVYFKALRTGYVHNPTTVERDENGKTVSCRHTGDFNDLESALVWVIEEACNYLKIKY